MSHQPPERHERDVIVTNGGGSDSAAGAVVAVLGVIAVVFILWLLFFSGDRDGDINIDLPDNPDVDIEQDFDSDEGGTFDDDGGTMDDDGGTFDDEEDPDAEG